MSPLQHLVSEYGWQVRRIKGTSALYIGILRQCGFHEKADEAQLVEEELCNAMRKVYIRKRSKIDPNFIP